MLAVSFSVLLPVVPVLVERRGAHGSAGIATTVLFIGMVCGEFVTPWLMSRFGPAKLLVAAELLIALPSLAYIVGQNSRFEMLLAAGFRGLGSGVGVVVSFALVTMLAPSNRRGRAIGYSGLATAAPGIVFPSIGVWLLEANQTDLAAIIALCSALLGALAGLAVRLPSSSAGVVVENNLMGAILSPAVLPVFSSFVLASATYGGIVTYIPVALPGSGPGSAAIFLLLSGSCRALSRWLSGLLADRYSSDSVLTGGLGLTAAALVVVAVHGGPTLVLAAATFYGFGFGAVQTGAFLLIAQRSQSYQLSVVSAVWNSGMDLGSATGGAGLGLVAALYGYSTAAWLMPTSIGTALSLLRLSGNGDTVPAEPHPRRL